MYRNKILIIENEHVYAAELNVILHNCNYDVIGITPSGEEAVEFLRNNTPDIILLDIQLKGKLDGIETAELLNELFDIPVVFLAENSDEQTLTRAKISHPLGYVMKPFEEKELHNSIEMALFKFDSDKKLKEIERRFNALNNSKLYLIFIQDFEGNIIDANPAALALFDISHYEIESINIADLINEKQLPVISDLIEDLKDKKPRSGVIELEVNSRNGSIYFIEVTASLVFKNSIPYAVQYIGRDITARKTTQEELIRSETKYRDLLERLSEGLVQVDNKDVILFVNPRFCEMTGYKPEEVLGKFFYKTFILENDWDFILKKNKERLSKKTDKYELQYKTKSNELLWAYVSAAPLLNEKNEVIGSFALFTDITDRKKAEKAVSHLAAIVESSSDAILSKTLDGFIITWNKGAELMYGYSRNEIIGKHISILSPPEKQEETSNILSSLRNGNIIDSFETVRVKKDGTKFSVSLTISPIIDPDGRIISFSTITRDITDYKKALETIRISEQKYRDIVELAPTGIFQVDEHGLILTSNLALAKILNFETPKFLNGLIIHENFFLDKTKFPQLIQEAQKSKTPVDTELQLRKRDGDIIWIQLNMHCLKDKTQEKKRFEGFVRDITKHKIAEGQIKMLSLAVQQSSSSIIITNTDGIIEYVNSKFSQITGYSPQEAVGRKPDLISTAYLKDEVKKQIRSTISSGTEWRGEFLNRKKNGELFWESATISPIMDEKGRITHFLSVQDDITLRKRQEQQLIEAKEIAEKSDKLKSEFLAQMSHEIRTPLNNILTYTSVLKEEFEDKLPEGLESTFQVIDNSSQRLIRTIELVLNLSRIQTGNYETTFQITDLDTDLLDDVVLEFYSRARQKNLELYYENKAENYTVMVDRYSVGQVFVNLIDNSLKYTEKGEINILLYNNNKKVCVDISDTGIGISQEYLSELFNPFSQEDTGMTRHFEGIGLGLALVKKYVEINRADIKVKSQKGKGTTFTIIFDPVK